MIDIKRASVSRTLAITAVSLWLVSLALPGFSVEYGETTMYGIYILFLGILFGWYVSGWAAYANVFFIMVAFKLLRKSDSIPTGITIAMVTLAASMPLFEGLILSEANLAIMPVVSWGWGAIFWLMSVGVLASATASRALLLPESIFKIVCVLLGAFLIAVGAYRMHQWGNASVQDREMYLPKSMAFSVADFCGVPLIWPTGPVVQAGETITVDIDARLRSVAAPDGPLKLPEFMRHERAGYDWEQFEPKGGPSMIIRSVASPKTIVLQVKSTPEGGVIKLLNTATGAVLYEQPLTLGITKNGHKRVCPLSGSDKRGGLSRGYYDALKVALGPVIKSSDTNVWFADAGDRKSQTKLINEEAKPCGSRGTYINVNDTEQELDGRHVVFGGYARKLSTFCSPSYVGLVFVGSGPVGRSRRLNSEVYLYDRKSLRPLASYYATPRCEDSGRCSATVPLENIVGLQIEDDKATVNTAEGLAVVERFF